MLILYSSFREHIIYKLYYTHTANILYHQLTCDDQLKLHFTFFTILKFLIWLLYYTMYTILSIGCWIINKELRIGTYNVYNGTNTIIPTMFPHEYFLWVKMLNKFHRLSSQPLRFATEHEYNIILLCTCIFLFDGLFYSTLYNSLIGQFDHNIIYT